MINLAQLPVRPLYIVHLSNGLGLDYLRLARANHQPVWVEPAHNISCWTNAVTIQKMA